VIDAAHIIDRTTRTTTDLYIASAFLNEHFVARVETEKRSRKEHNPVHLRQQRTCTNPSVDNEAHYFVVLEEGSLAGASRELSIDLIVSLSLIQGEDSIHPFSMHILQSIIHISILSGMTRSQAAAR
jgi:hypothetical protein